MVPNEPTPIIATLIFVSSFPINFTGYLQITICLSVIHFKVAKCVPIEKSTNKSKLHPKICTVFST